MVALLTVTFLLSFDFLSHLDVTSHILSSLVAWLVSSGRFLLFLSPSLHFSPLHHRTFGMERCSQCLRSRAILHFPLPLSGGGGVVTVEVTVNGIDYTNSQVTFAYLNTPCGSGADSGGAPGPGNGNIIIASGGGGGSYCQGTPPQLCPNGTYCPVHANNFTLCGPGTFQPKEGQSQCLPCPVGKSVIPLITRLAYLASFNICPHLI